jgi:hypothetical protein
MLPTSGCSADSLTIPSSSTSVTVMLTLISALPPDESVTRILKM